MTGKNHRLAGAMAALAMVFALAALPGSGMAETSAIDMLRQQSKARAAIVKAISPAVVHISVEKSVKGRSQPELPDMFNDEFFRKFFKPRLPSQPREFKQRGLGSGSIFDSKGYIITNNHVVADADKIIVKLPDGREFKATLVGADPATDLAVIKIEGKDLPVAKLGNSDQIDVGESVIAIGNPFGLEQTVTAGIVSAKGRSQVGLTDYEDFIQTDASINPGNSGGPLISLDGEIIGINTAIYSRSGGNQGIGFAIPINMAKSIMKDLIANGRVTRGFLGVVIQDVTQEIAGALGIDVNGGVLISNVGPNTPAGEAGIAQGDLIVKFDGKPVASSNELRNAVAAIRPGTTVPVDLLRKGAKKRVQVTVREQPSDMRAAIGGTGGGNRESKPEEPPKPESVLGMEIQPLTPELADQMGYKGMRGVVITRVEQDSPAANAGLQRGALILEANQQSVSEPKDLKSAVAKIKSGQHILLLVRMGDFNRFVGVQKP